jgi:hypothetical protein
MLRVELEVFESESCSSEVKIFSSDDNLVRRVIRNNRCEVVLDFTYEYDAQGKCTSGLVLNGRQEVVCTLENFYTDSGVYIGSIERDPVGAEVNRVVYKLSEKETASLVEFFSRGEKVGYAVPVDSEDEYSAMEYFTSDNQKVPYVELDSLIEKNI